MTNIGIIGVGYLGACLAEGLAGAGTFLILSPRSTSRTAELSARFGCTIAANNAEVVQRSDLVFLSTRPGQIAETATGLPWRAGQRVVSIAAGIRLNTIQAAVAPAIAVRAMPIAASRIRRSPTAFHPNDPEANAILARLGPALPFEDEAEFDTASIFGAYYAMMYAFIDEVAGWAEANGLSSVSARTLTAHMTEAAAAAVIEGKAVKPRELLNELLTPGGISEEGLKVLEETGALSRWPDALDASLKRARAIDAG